MSDAISIKSLTPELYPTYIEVGTKAYNQHYRHLWPNGESTPYLESSFAEKVLLLEEEDSNTELFIIYSDEIPVGVLKFSKDKPVGIFSASDALLLDKIYILNQYSGKGIGKEVLNFILSHAKSLKKKIVWLDAMQKGAALKFYLKNDFEIYSEKDHPSKLVITEERRMYILIKHLKSVEL